MSIHFPAFFHCRVLFAVVIASALPAQAPSLMDATVLPGDALIGQAVGTQRNAAMAAGATSSLVVFEDNRAGDFDLFGVRVGASGAVIDALPFPITKAPGNQTAPQVVWNGQDWLVAYASEFDPGSGYWATQIAAVRVSAQGVVRDPSPLLMTNDNMTFFAVGSDGNQWVVASAGFWAGNSEIRARRITAGGVLLDPGGVLVQAVPGMNAFQLGVSFAQGQFLFTWDEMGLRGRRFTPALTAIDPVAVAIPTGTGVVLGNGASYLMAWVHENPVFQSFVAVRRFAANLAPMDPGPILLSNVTTNPAPTDVRAVWDGTQWIVSWLDPALEAHAARVSSGGAVLDPGGVVLPDNAPVYLNGPALGSLPGGGALQLWHDTRFASADDVYGTPFTAAGSTGAERCLSLGTEALRAPRVTAGAGGFLVTASGELSTGSRILAWRIDALGRSLDAQPIVVATANQAGLQVGGAAWNGTHYLLTWANSAINQIYGRRMNPDGSWADGAPIPVMPGFRPDVAASVSNANFLVTGLRYPSNPQFVFSYAARVRGSDGAVLDAPALSIGSSYATRARAVDLAGRWLVATERHFSHNDNQATVLLHFVDGSGLVTAAGITMVLNIKDWGSIDVASAGTSALVVAQDGSNWTNNEIHVQRILPTGAMPSAMFPITNAAPMGQFLPSVAWNGREYVVSYETYQNNVWSYDFEPDIYGIRVAETGIVIDVNGFPLWSSEDYEQRVDGDGNGKALYAASVYLDGPFAAPRVQVRVQRPIGLTGYGTGTPGCFGPHGIDANSAPTAGNTGFAVVADRGPTSGLGLMVLGTAGSPIGFDPGLGVLVHVSVVAPAQVVILGLPVDPNGVGTLAFPLPAQPSLYGFQLFAQAAFLWNGPCTPSVSNFSTSQGLQIVIQAP